MFRWMTILAFSLLLVVGLAACGGGKEDGANDTEETEENGDTGSEGESVDVAAAEASFEQSCASCHGQNLEGQGNAPSLEKVGKKMNKEEILSKIQNGGGGMPPNLIEGQEAENVAAWLATMK